MSDETIDKIATVIGMILALYIFISFWGCFIGAVSPQEFCEKPKIRVGYLLPAFDLGCWLTEVPK